MELCLNFFEKILQYNNVTLNDDYLQMRWVAMKSIVFNPNTKTVDLQYTSGDKVYTYRNIDKNEVSNFLNAPSKGRYVVYNWNHNNYHSIFKK